MKERNLWVSGAEVSHRIYDSETPGPVLAITAAVHGDELTGIGAIRALMTLLPTILRRGRVHLFPCLNPGGVANRTRYFPGTKLDINRSFPGNPTGNPAERHAWLIWERLSADKPDFLIDLHADSFVSIPYAIVDRDLNASPGLAQSCCSLATSTGIFTLWEYQKTDYERFGLVRSLSGSVVNQWRRPAITIESGPRGQLDAPSVEQMLDAILSAMSHLEMVDSSYAQNPREENPIWFRSNGPTFRHSGMFKPMAPLGQKLSKGDLLGIVFSTSGIELESCQLHKDAVVIAYPNHSFVRVGERCATLATS